MKPTKIAIVAGLCLFTWAMAGHDSKVSAQSDDNQNKSSLAINASQYGVGYPETFVLMQNRMGIRIEYNLDRSNLQLWISPQAGKSTDYRDKNWSNRDDHTNIFDRILLPALNLNDFVSCDYDPFHSILNFKNQKLHIASVYDKPVVLVWFEKDSIVDFKSAGSDKPVRQTDKSFVIEHTDRGRTFEFAAALGNGAGAFQQQRITDEGRSIYSRAYIKGGQLLVIAGELKKEDIRRTAAEIASQNVDVLLAENEKKITKDLERGRFRLKGRPDMQKLLDINRRIVLSMQDIKGFIRTTNQYIYYLLWFRDGGIDTALTAYTGWVNPVRDQVNFALLNPNISTEEPKGRFFGQIMAGPITKWEEDGLFYVVWPAFTYWTQTGDDAFCRGKYLRTMEEAMDWLERYCFDRERGLFGRYYASEGPLTNSRGDGWDDAVGRPSDKWPSIYEGKTIARSYDIYINTLNYNVYVMLSAMEDGKKADKYLDKAIRLEENIRKFFDCNGPLPSSGGFLTIDNKYITAKPYTLDRADYQWSLSLPLFQPNRPGKYRDARNRLLEDIIASPKGNFLCNYISIVANMDTEMHNEDDIMRALDYLVPQSVRPGKYLPMPYTIPEIIDIKDGDPFHDVRPIVFSISPWLAAVTNLGIHRLPFGIAARGTKYLDNIEDYEYKGALINATFEGTGGILEVVLNGKPLPHTYQIPESLLKKGKNRLVIRMAEAANGEDTLISSTVRLGSACETGGTVRLDIEAFGRNVLVFKNLGKKVAIADSAGRPVAADIQKMDAFSFVEFKGRGLFTVMLN